jgi:acyl carrier protein
MTDTFDRLSAILIKDYKFEPGRLELDVPLEVLGIDSLGTAELLFNIEDEFGVTLPPDPVQLTTLGDVVSFIDALVAAKGVRQVTAASSPTFVVSGS